MITQTGFQHPTALQRKQVRAAADDSFCAVMPADFDLRIPCQSGYVFDPRTLTALTLKNVTPHTDCWVGDNHPADGEDGPARRLALFWLVDIAPHQSLHFMCGDSAHEMRAGAFVVFDDRIHHCVLSTRRWFGLAYQLRPIE